ILSSDNSRLKNSRNGDAGSYCLGDGSLPKDDPFPPLKMGSHDGQGDISLFNVFVFGQEADKLLHLLTSDKSYSGNLIVKPQLLRKMGDKFPHSLRREAHGIQATDQGTHAAPCQAVNGNAIFLQLLKDTDMGKTAGS